jgi:hypothetical protein
MGAQGIIGGVHGDPENDKGVVDGVALLQPIEGFVGFSQSRVYGGNFVGAIVRTGFVCLQGDG